MTTREKAMVIFEAGVAAVQPKELLKKYLAANATTIRIGNKHFEREAITRLVVIAVGKAAAGMAVEAENILGNAISYGFCITKHGHALTLKQLVIIEAGHPFPDKESVQAAMHIQQMIECCEADDIILLLLSGGASSLLADLPAGCNLNHLQQLNKLLVNSGASINEINTVRKHLGTLKGGKMAAIASPATLVTLAISDVVNDDPSVIASGLTVPDTTTYADAEKVLKKYNLWQHLPYPVKSHFEKGLRGEIPGNPRPGDTCFENTQYYLAGNNSLALQGAELAAQRLGFHTSIFKAGLIENVFTASRSLIQQFKDYRGIKPACFLLGGEPTLMVQGNGFGGRCQHFALVALHEMNRCGGADMRGALTILAAGTDGTDGPTDAAGAVADMQTMQHTIKQKIPLDEYLQTFDAYDFFEQAGGLIKTGATQTNVGDIIVLLVED